LPEVEPSPSGAPESRFRALRLEPGFAARFGIPLRPLVRKAKQSARHQTIDIGGVSMAYRAEGRGRPVVLLGGGIGSMDVWRNVVPQISSSAQVISIDLIGFGYSDRIPNADASYYDWDTQVGYLDACFDKLGLGGDLTLVSHGWNSIVAIEWARIYEDRVRAISYADGILRPMAWSEADPWLRQIVRRARSEDDEYFLETDEFLMDALKELCPTALSADQVDDFRRALGDAGTDRIAHMAALANIPIGGEPVRASEMMHRCYQWLKTTDIPKLLILGKPGYLLVRRGRKLAARLPHQTVATVDGRHLLPMTAADAIGRFFQLWLAGV
jgi:pimeloyl-ACP methyl ester carboxylesterase